MFAGLKVCARGSRGVMVLQKQNGRKEREREHPSLEATFVPLHSRFWWQTSHGLFMCKVECKKSYTVSSFSSLRRFLSSP